ncbi:MAG: redox-sensing transcriptional repressor Rex [Ruminococcus sp.]|nr:redox-sensing transcriptional repressor Rex [Ruminococcus sp.]
MQKDSISESVIRRLPRYYRFLSELEAAGTQRTSSRELAAQLGLTASQIRQDLNCFGEFGQQGYGYNVTALRRQLELIIGLNQSRPAIIVGAGNLGKVIAANIDFAAYGFRLTGIFDIDRNICGTEIAGFTVTHMDTLETFCGEVHPVVAVLCIPQEAAQETADHLGALGISGFWNFSHCDLETDRSRIQVENVHLGDSLMTLSFRMPKKD